MTNTKNAMNFGAILGLSLCVVSAIFMSLGAETSNVQQWIGYILTIGVISWGTISFRDKYNDGFISYSKAFTSCLLITFFSSIILAFFMYLYLSFIDQSLIDQVLEKAEEDMLNRKMPDDQIEEAMKMTRMLTTPILMGFFTIIVNSFMGAIFGLITAAFLKRDNPNFNNFIKENQ
jgi:NADH:ubiquinone oxidoreductase subunit 6 (subunit J)